MEQDSFYMQQVLELARKGQGRTSPNPMVGALIVKDGEIIGSGYHCQAGTPHAEIHALAQAGTKAKAATLYVNLEPCSHYGRMPPCALALIEAEIKRVVAAVLDPNPLVAGQGISLLQAAGVEVTVGVLEKEARQLNEIFFKYISQGLPFVSLKTAMTLDGKIASVSGDSRWISGTTSRQLVHELRDSYDAVMVGIGTVLADDPRLDTRLDRVEIKNPVRVIIDDKLQLPQSCQIVATAEKIRTLVYTLTGADKGRQTFLKNCGIEIIEIDGINEQLDLKSVMLDLAKQQITSLLVEGGAGINASMLQAGLVDKVYWFIAPKIIGGQKALSPIGGDGQEKMASAWQLQNIEIKKSGEDILVIGYIGQQEGCEQLFLPE